MTYIQPLILLCGLVATVGLLNVRSPRGRWIAWSGLIALLLLAWPPVDWLLALPLVARYPVVPFRPPPGLQAIVVLGSTAEPPEYARPYPLPDTATFHRCEHAVWLYRQWGPLPVLACEGRPSAPPGSVMRDLLRRGGVADKLIWVEENSRSTHENAVYGAAILRQHGMKRIALIVDAQSMPRAAACFRKEGLDVTPAPSDFRTLGPWSQELIPSWRAIRRNEITLHETLGIAWYRIRGWM